MQKTELLTPFGARATIYHQGAHVTSWVPSESLGEQLFLAQQSEFAAGKAIRGGVPVCFPQFAAFGNGIKHGFARNVEWQLVSVTADQTEVVFVLADSPQTRELWPHAFNLLLRVTVEPMKLIIRLKVVNCGDELFEFGGHLVAVGLRGVLVHDRTERINSLAVQQDVDLDQVGHLFSGRLVIERCVPTRA